MTTLPTLYKRTSTGALQEWTISFESNWYAASFGQTGGAIQTAAPTFCTGKQKRTDEQQAEFEARALWTKKKKKDYTEDPDVKAGDTSDLIEGGVLPMLAAKYSDHKAKVKWPMQAQAKLDGHRCIAVVDANGKCTLWSRTRKPILSMPHIVKAVEGQCAPSTILDGELFATGYNDRFEELTSLIRPNQAKSGHEQLEYWVYDCVNEHPFHIRNLQVERLRKPLVSVETVEVNSEDEMRALFGQYIEAGFEGLMLRDPDSLYVHKRSTGLLKVKERDDAEFELLAVEEGRGKLAGHGIFVLTTVDGKQFRAKMKGDTAKLREYWNNQEQYIGRQVTVAFQGVTSDGIPRFPVATRIHNTL